MARFINRLTALIISLSLLVFALEAIADEIEVDLALVLAVDVSYSMDPDEQDLQRQGFIEAFRSPAVHDAIRRGALGRIAVVYVEWSGVANQNAIVPWRVIEDPESAAGFADHLAQFPTRRVGKTSISEAIDFSVRLLEDSNLDAIRRVIDISGDGPNNEGRNVAQARDQAVEKGVTINGLPIMLKRKIFRWEIEDVDVYFRECVIGGPGAFIVPVRERHHFADAIRTKIIREIADEQPTDLLVKPAKADEWANCFNRG